MQSFHRIHHPIHWLCIAVALLTLIDTICTAAGVSLGVITEGNPIWQSVMQERPVLTGVFVVAYTGLLLDGVYKYGRRCRVTVPLLAFVCAIKVVVVAIHINWITQVM